MKRALWTAALSESHSPAWPCPACAKGTLALVSKSLAFRETLVSKRNRHEDEWTPEDIEYAFTAWLKCTQASCEQEVAVSGVGGIEQWQTLGEDGEPDTSYSKYFTPQYFSHIPDIFEMPKKCPEEVVKHLRAGFRLFFLDRSAAANRIRVALERLLDHLGVPKRRKEQNNRFSDLSLHKRIEAFIKDEPSLGAQLMALKWLGNTASHEGSVSRDELLDAFEILEHCLLELIERRSARVAELARRLTRKHGGR